MRNINELAKKYKEAEIWFHIDLDGVTTAIAMREYLKSYGIVTKDAYPIQYGNKEFTTHKMTPGRLHVLVDFSHSKPGIHIHTDHHDNQTGVSQISSNYFAKSPSNASAISENISSSKIYTTNDAKIIDMIDSADFAKNNITFGNAMETVFKFNKDVSTHTNSVFFGLVANNILLAYKNKKDLLKNVCLNSTPSLKNIYLNVCKEAKALGFDLSKHKISANKYLKESELKKDSNKLYSNGSTTMVYGLSAKAFSPCSYNRYVPFKIYPKTDYNCICWPMGFVQVSKNPFKIAENPYYLKDIAWNVMEKYKAKLKTKINLLKAKEVFENDVIHNKNSYPVKDSMNFQFVDFINLFSKSINIKQDSGFGKALQNISEKHLNDLTERQREVLSKVSISVWDIMKEISGGHKDITTISGWNFYPNNYVELMKNYWKDLGEVMKDKHLQKESKCINLKVTSL